MEGCAKEIFKRDSISDELVSFKCSIFPIVKGAGMKRRAFILLLAIALGTANLAGSAPVYAAQEEDIQVIEEAGQEDSADQASEMEQDNASPEEDTHTGEEDDQLLSDTQLVEFKELIEYSIGS